MKRFLLLAVLLISGCVRTHYIVPRNAVVRPSGRQWVQVWVPTELTKDGKMAAGVERWVEVDGTWVLVRE